MIIHKTMDSGWLSNTWLVADEPGGHAVVIDTGGPMQPILKHIEEYRLEISHVLCTHHHHDHVAHNNEYKHRFGCPVCGHKAEEKLFAHGLDTTLEHGDELVTGGLRIRALHLPGHTRGQLGLLINEQHVFTGDTLFEGSVGGTRAPGHTHFKDLQHSIMEVLMSLPHETKVYPGHMGATSIGREWEENPFIRAWRGIEQASSRRCTAHGQPAELLLRARDYDGGGKCWIRLCDSDEMDIVAGSRVELV